MVETTDYSRIATGYIRQLTTEFKNNPYNFLSESDVKCRLHMIMCQDNALSGLKPTNDGKQISPLHSEVSYFDRNGKLLFHVDLSAIDPGTTNVYSKIRKGGVRLAKGYRAGECYLAIEIKLNKSDSKRKMIAKWEKDMRKLEDIKTRNPSLTCFSILLDKRSHISSDDELAQLPEAFPNTKIVYANAVGNEYFIDF
jgi:hypothetical protein